MDIPQAEPKQEEYEAQLEGEELTDEVQPVAVETEPTPAQATPAQPGHNPSGPAQLGRMDKLKQFYRECMRVYKVTKKPDREEFKTIVKVSAIGILIIGALGFIVSLIQRLFVG
jgi:protein transport protein SEC61 subunit gamma-like protein